jgi:hypothetical protein
MPTVRVGRCGELPAPSSESPVSITYSRATLYNFPTDLSLNPSSDVHGDPAARFDVCLAQQDRREVHLDQTIVVHVRCRRPIILTSPRARLLTVCPPYVPKSQSCRWQKVHRDNWPNGGDEHNDGRCLRPALQGGELERSGAQRRLVSIDGYTLALSGSN